VARSRNDLIGFDIGIFILSIAFHASEGDVLRVLMAANGVSQSKLAKEVGVSPSTISSVLSGARSLTKDQVVKLARFFHVSTSVFMPV
jgi:plasmid maintenance system antidote protein VapI